MSVILSLDTSSPTCSAAIHQTGNLIIAREIDEEQAHAAQLAPLIKALFDSSGINPSDLKAVAITSGPGSYTGLRIGTSTAKGICFALGIPLIACDTLTVMAKQVSDRGLDQALLCPMLDARRMEVYCAVFDQNLKAVSPIEAKVVDTDSFAELLTRGKIIFFGQGASKCREVIKHPNAVFLENVVPRASTLGDIAWRKFLAGDFVDLIHFEPIYLKEFTIKKSTKLDSLLNK